MDPRQATLNDFQTCVERRLNAELNDLGLRIDLRRVGWEEIPFPVSSKNREAVVEIRAKELSVRIREDSVGYEISGKGDYYEMQDYGNPDALADAFLPVLSKRWRNRPGT